MAARDDVLRDAGKVDAGMRALSSHLNGSLHRSLAS